MQYPFYLQSERLYLEVLTLNHAAFLHQLVNTDTWKEYIGERNINSIEDAVVYIERILNKGNMYYWCVFDKNTNLAIGMVTVIKRDYLEYFDLGFAFLPEATGKGFAYEAATLVVDSVRDSKLFKTLLGMADPRNNNSIKLLKRLGFIEKETIYEDGGELLVLEQHIL